MDQETKKKILVVEDQKDIADTLQKKFESNKIDPIMAYDGEEGLRLALENHPDLILLDLILPKLDGMSVLKELRQDEWGKNVPVIILSNLGTGDEIEKAKEFDVSEFLIKTEWRLDDVVSKVHSLI